MIKKKSKQVIGGRLLAKKCLKEDSPDITKSLLKTPTNNHFIKKDVKFIYKFTKDKLIYIANIMKEIVPEIKISVEQLLENYHKECEAHKKLKEDIEKQNKKLEEYSRIQVIYKENEYSVEGIYKSLLETICTMKLINPHKQYKHIETNLQGVIETINNIRAYDGILEFDTDIPSDILRGYYKIKDNKIVLCKETKQKYLGTLKKGVL